MNVFALKTPVENIKEKIKEFVKENPKTTIAAATIFSPLAGIAPAIALQEEKK